MWVAGKPCRLSLTGDKEECAQWIGWAKDKLKRLRLVGNPVRKTYALDGAEVKVTTGFGVVDSIKIKAEGERFGVVHRIHYAPNRHLCLLLDLTKAAIPDHWTLLGDIDTTVAPYTEVSSPAIRFNVYRGRATLNLFDGAASPQDYNREIVLKRGALSATAMAAFSFDGGATTLPWTCWVATVDDRHYRGATIAYIAQPSLDPLGAAIHTLNAWIAWRGGSQSDLRWPVVAYPVPFPAGYYPADPWFEPRPCVRRKAVIHTGLSISGFNYLEAVFLTTFKRGGAVSQEALVGLSWAMPAGGWRFAAILKSETRQGWALRYFRGRNYIPMVGPESALIYFYIDGDLAATLNLAPYADYGELHYNLATVPEFWEINPTTFGFVAIASRYLAFDEDHPQVAVFGRLTKNDIGTWVATIAAIRTRTVFAGDGSHGPYTIFTDLSTGVPRLCALNLLTAAVTDLSALPYRDFTGTPYVMPALGIDGFGDWNFTARILSTT